MQHASPEYQAPPPEYVSEPCILASRVQVYLPPNTAPCPPPRPLSPSLPSGPRSARTDEEQAHAQDMVGTLREACAVQPPLEQTR